MPELVYEKKISVCNYLRDRGTFSTTLVKPVAQFKRCNGPVGFIREKETIGHVGFTDCASSDSQFAGSSIHWKFSSNYYIHLDVTLVQSVLKSPRFCILAAQPTIYDQMKQLHHHHPNQKMHAMVYDREIHHFRSLLTPDKSITQGEVCCPMREMAFLVSERLPFYPGSIKCLRATEAISQFSAYLMIHWQYDSTQHKHLTVLARFQLISDS